jgi:hypothetical protein
MQETVRRGLAAALIALTLPAAASAAGPDASLRAKVLAAFSGLHSYKLTVLGSVRSVGVWVAPNRYQMTTEFEGKPVKTIIVGNTYWTYSDGKWEKSGTTSNNLDVDIAGLVRNAKANGDVPFVRLADQVQDGKRVGTFQYDFKDGTEETCNFDLRSYRVTRCKADQLTLLYSAYNDPGNSVVKPS